MLLKSYPKMARPSSSQSFNVKKFVSAKAEVRFNDSIIKRVGLKERGFDLELHRFPDICAIIERWGWQKFCQQLASAAMTAVWEFYANTKETTGPATMVCEKTIKFNIVTINRFYQIPILVIDKLTVLPNTTDMDKVAHEIYGKAINWTIVKGVCTLFLTKELLIKMKIWHHYLCAKLSPTTHLTEVTKERALMPYAITRACPLM